MHRLKGRLKTLPVLPGVYLFKDKSDKVVYVGKALNLRSRVSSYFAATETLIPKVRRLMAVAADLEIVVTDSELEAVFLECNLIKKFQPYYNVRLKDDKSYPYLKVSLNEDWPRVYVTRRLERDGSMYFGPYASGMSVRITMNLVKKLFPYRTCRKKITGTDSRPCLEYHINRCVAPCIGAVSRQEYDEVIRQVILFLEGRQDRIVAQLKRKMEQASESQDYEKAAVIRDQLQAIEKVVERQKVVSVKAVDEDVIGYARQDDEACVQVFFVRRGKLIGNEHFILGGTRDEDPALIMSSFIKQFYGSASSIPPHILVAHQADDSEAVAEWLTAKRGAKVNILEPQRGAKKYLVDMATQNATQLLRQRKVRKLSEAGKTAEALLELQQKLSLPKLPNRIECYDISNIQGTSAVGSMVVFIDGKPKSSEYRRFSVKMVDGVDDYAMMREVLLRRFVRAASSPEEGSSWAVMPDLLLIDGGKGHLGVAIDVLKTRGIDTVAPASIAKENEEVFLPTQDDPVTLPATSQALYLLQRIRDEAHRFAVTYHRKVRAKSAVKSVLDEVQGIGPKKKKALMRHFGSVAKMRDASIEELSKVDGVTVALAQQLKESI
ncbi:MAG: excinuclease ABC subunit UvrC [Chloroflexi bacterium]|jgi:excinuclease ABC subunit C|nr:excinuclease ABC subunit UvrC [Chloroflexota bacterium]MBT7080016.1 excinuclease ABC subunit UvrC [Chloroflexota bacterium]MBT7289398.1 excinuclease ABC subunit UvrC [Chloroflexota bacterium]